MKNLYKSLAFAAIAAATLISCNKEPQPVEQPGPKTGATVIEFNAQVADPGTKATLTPNEGETEFTAAWEGNDELRLIVSNSSDTEETTATWDATKSVFSATFQDLSGQNTWTYKAIWPVPSKDGIDFGSGRVQNGNAYNSAYDVMFGSKTVTAEIGMESDNKTPLVVPMNRLTGIAYFHITSNLPDGEKVVSATLKANNIAAETVSVNTASGTLVVPETKLNEITITFEDGTAPSAQDFQLWFNVLPGSYSGLELTIETSFHTATLNPTATFTYTAGKLNKAVLASLSWDTKPFYESFNSTNGTGGNDDSWNGSIASSSIVTDYPGWTFTHGGGAKACVKFGTGSAKGSALTPALGLSSDLTTLSFKAAAWLSNDESTDLNLTLVGSGLLSKSSVVLGKGEWTTYKVYIVDADQDTKVLFEAKNASKNRFFLDEVAVIAGGESFDYLVVPNEVSVAFNATTASFDIKTGSSWTITGADGLTIDKTSGNGNDTVTLSFPQNSTASDITIAALTVTAGSLSKTVTITQSGNPEAIEELTIAQFLDKEVGDPYYRLSGTVTEITNTSYGNFKLVDETGSVLVYGLTSTKVSSNDQSFASLGIDEGDFVTLEGKRAVYGDTPQVGGPAYHISHVKAPTLSVNPTSLVFTADGGEETVTATAANFSGNVTITAESDNAQFTTSVSNNSITVVAAENTGNAVQTGVITVTATDGTSTKTATVEVNQNKASQPAQDGDILWQEDFTGYGSSMPASASGGHVYEGGTVAYTLGGNTSLYSDQNLAGGTAPELLVSKSNGFFKVSGIPVASASVVTLSYKTNNDNCVITPSTGVTVRTNGTLFSSKTKTVVLDISEGTKTFDLEFKNTNTSSNCRVDDFRIEVGAPAPQVSVTTLAATATTTADGTTATLNGTISLTFGDISDITEAGFYYKLSSGSSYSKVTTNTISSSFSVDLTGLTSGSEYTFYAFAKCGNEVNGNNLTFTPISNTSHDPIVITLDCSSNIFGLPTSGNAASEEITKTVDGYSYKLYATSGCYYYGSKALLIGKSGSYITFPAIANYKLVSVKASNCEGASSKATISIVPLNSTSAVSGGSASTIAAGGSHTWTLSGTSNNTAYRIYIGNANNVQYTQIVLTYN